MSEARTLSSDEVYISIHNKFDDSTSSSSGYLSKERVLFKESRMLIENYHGSNYEMGDEVIEIPYSKICFFQEKREYTDLGVTKPKLFGKSKKKVRKEHGWSFLLEGGTHILFKKRKELEAKADFDFSGDMEDPQICSDKQSLIKTKIVELLSDLTGLVLVESYYGSDGELRVEGWKEGDAELNADINASAKTIGRSHSRSSIEGDISGEITDNTYSTPIDAFFVLEDRLVIDSRLELDLYYSEIDRVTRTHEGLVIQVGETTYRTEVTKSENLDKAINHIQDQISNANKSESNSTTASADKLRELNQLYDEGLISEEEFESTKSDILDDF